MKLPFRGPRNPEAVPEPVEHAPAPGPVPSLHLEAAAAQTQRDLDTLSRRVEAHAHSLDALSSQVGDLRERMDRLTIAVAEGIEHVERAERRVRATVARARRELSEDGVAHPGLEAEHAQLRDGDGDGGEERGVQPVREEVDRSGIQVELGDSFPGSWTEGDLEALTPYVDPGDQ